MRSSTAMRPTARAYSLLRTHGLRAGSREILKKLSKRINEYNGDRSYLVIAKSLESGEVIKGRSSSSRVISVREGEPAEILALRPDDQPRMQSYLSKKYRCAILTIDGETAGWCWWIDPHVSRQGSIDYQLAFLDVDLDEGDVWCFDFYVAPTYRGEGRATHALAELEGMLALYGYRKMMGCVEATNIAALWLYKLRGFRTLTTVKATYLFSLIGISRGRLVVRVNEGRGPATFPFRPIRVLHS
jgi:ribosomal protein S18 acetylase RimI-like enzyme